MMSFFSRVYLLFSFIWTFSSSLDQRAHHSSSSSQSQGRRIEDHKEIQLDFHKLRKLPLSFPHIRQLFKSIDKKLQKFHVHEFIDLSPRPEGTTKEANSHAHKDDNHHMHSTTTYEFFDRNVASYHNIDSFKSQEFKSFSSSHMVHCNDENDISTGSFILGTKAGFWYHEAKVRCELFLLHTHSYIVKY